MKTQNIRLHKLKDDEPIPFELLLMADETVDAIKKYIDASAIYTVYTNDNINPIGVFVLYRINDSVLEIKNSGFWNYIVAEE